MDFGVSSSACEVCCEGEVLIRAVGDFSWGNPTMNLGLQRQRGGGTGTPCYPHVPTESPPVAHGVSSSDFESCGKSEFLLLAVRCNSWGVTTVSLGLQRQRGGGTGLSCCPHVPTESPPVDLGVSSSASESCCDSGALILAQGDYSWGVTTVSLSLQRQRGGGTGLSCCPHVPTESPPVDLGVSSSALESCCAGEALILAQVDYSWDVATLHLGLQRQRGGGTGTPCYPHVPTESPPVDHGVSSSAFESCGKRASLMPAMGCNSWGVTIVSLGLQRQRGGGTGLSCYPHVPTESPPVDFGVSSSAFESCDKSELSILAVCDNSRVATSCQCRVSLGPGILVPCHATGPFVSGAEPFCQLSCKLDHGVEARCIFSLCTGGITACCHGSICDSQVLTVSVSASGVRGCLRNGTPPCGDAMQLSYVSIASTGVCNASIRALGCEPSVLTTFLPAASYFAVVRPSSILSFGGSVRSWLVFFFHGGTLCLGFSTVGRFDPICEAMPVRSAEVQFLFCSPLQRQIWLPIVHGFSNDLDLSICHCGSGTVYGAPCVAPSSFVRRRTADHDMAISWFCSRLCHFQHDMEFLLLSLISWSWIGIQYVGEWWQQAFTHLAVFGSIYLCRLLLYASRLKGGRCNADNLLRGASRLCEACPLDLAIGLQSFSPRLSWRQQPRRLGFSRHLWLLLLLLANLCTCAQAGSSRQFNVDSTGFREERRSRKLSSAICNLRSACRHVDSPDTPDENPNGGPPDSPSGSEDDWDFTTESFLCQFFAFGCLPAYRVCAFFQGISLQEAIEQISGDAVVPIRAESGGFIPAKGVPLGDSVTLLWMPDWLLQSRNTLLFIDVTMLGKYSFVIQYSGFAISYEALAEQLQPIWEEEMGHVYMFVPYFSGDPVQEHTRFPAVNGLTIVLQRDAVPPACIPDPAEAFQQYRLWGLDVDNLDQPPTDLPWPVDKVQLTVGTDTGLYSIGGQAATLPVLHEVASRFFFGEEQLQVWVADFVPERYVWYGEPVSRIGAVSSTPTQPGAVCVFLILRGIGRESRAAWFPHSVTSRFGILDMLKHDIAVITGFKVSITGGQYSRGNITLWHGDVLFLNFVPDDAELEDTESESEAASDLTLAEPEAGDNIETADDCDDERAVGGGNVASPVAEQKGGGMSEPQAHHAAPEHDVTELLDKWNHDHGFSSAILSGNQGDTPAGRSVHHVSVECSDGAASFARDRALNLGFRASAVTSGIRLYMAGMVFLQHVLPGASVMLPIEGYATHEELSHPLTGLRVPESHTLGSLDGSGSCKLGGYHTPTEWHPAHLESGKDSDHLHHWTAQGTHTGETGVEGESPLVTLLEQAKSDDFYRLCADLAWFIAKLVSAADWDQGDEGVCCSLHVHSVQSLVQCTYPIESSIACQMSQTEGSPWQPCQPSASSGRVVLELNSILGKPQFQQGHARSRLACGVDLDMLELLLEGHRFERLCKEVQLAQDMHPHARMALQDTPLWNGTDPFSKVALYTDGSFKEGHVVVAYSVVVLLQVQEQWQFAGYMTGAVDTSDPSIDVSASAHVAELCGMVHARLVHLAIDNVAPVEICYDCMSACQVMRLGGPKGAPIDKLAVALDALCLHLNAQPCWSHVQGHSGHPWNEVADVLARRQLQHVIVSPEFDQDLVGEMLRDGFLKWIWLAVAADRSPSCWPEAHPDGSFSSTTFSQVRRAQHAVPNQPLQCQHVFHIRATTYNTLSLRVAGQVECLEQHFGNQGCCILGLQECRQYHTGIEHGRYFVKFASPALQGQGGCQIWLSRFSHPGVDSEGNAVRWRADTFATLHSDHRCLSISGLAGNVRFGIVAAHARTASSKQDEIQSFWNMLTRVIAQLPETSIKILLIDANASFDPTCLEHVYYRALDDNARAMEVFMRQTNMAPSDLWDLEGNEVKTWRSPTGFEKALDYILVPQAMSMHLLTLGVDRELLDLFSDIDHRPLTVALSFALKAVAPTQRGPRFDVKAMSSEEGQRKLRDIFSHAPSIPWDTHACDHWEQLQTYLTRRCSEAFPAVSKGPRKTYISEELWSLIVSQRRIRGQLRNRNQTVKSEILYACFQAWRDAIGQVVSSWHRSGSVCGFRGKLCRHDRQVAFLWHQLISLRRDINAQMKVCQAGRARQAFVDAREEGPGAIARLMTALLKSGRRYKPPQTLPPIKNAHGHLLTAEADVFRALGDHFAGAEKAIRVERQELLDLVETDTDFPAAELDGSIVPDLADLSTALRRAKGGKAPGASGLKLEIFKSAATPAAVVLYPLMLKQMLRGETPIAFLRSQICPIPKPGKCPNNLSGWRSIALQEIPHKAACTTMRRFLLQALDKMAMPLQLGGRPGGPMTVPALHVAAHLRRMRRLKQSAGVLYIDGVQAFYSTIREIVTGADETEAGVARIISLIEDMHSDEVVRADLFRLLCGPPILEQAGIPPFVRDFLRAGFRGSHFCMDRGDENLYVTQAGTIPGSPLADVVFQLALVRFHKNLQTRLRAQTLLVNVIFAGDRQGGTETEVVEASTCTWVDDLAIVVASPTAAGLVPKLARVASVVEQALCSTGVQVNYTPGKTEAMYCLRGSGARLVKRFWAIEQHCRVQLPLGPGQGKFLQLTSEYTHLGSRLQANGQQFAAIDHRVSVAKPLFAALRRRLLFNACLTHAEKVRLVVQGPLASLLHGSGLWVTSDKKTACRAYEAISDMYRQCVRPILGISSRGLANDEVCQVLGVLPPAAVLRFQRMRATLSVASLADKYLAVVLAQERTWIELVVDDWASFPKLACPLESACRPFLCTQVLAFFEWLHSHSKSFKLKIRGFIKQQLQVLASHTERVLHKARLLDEMFSRHAFSWRQPTFSTTAIPLVACPECHKVLQGRAALASHRSKTHGVVALGSLLHDHTACPVCLVEYWSPSRLWEHLRKSTRCRRTFEASDPVLLKTSKSFSKASDLPAVRIEGPQEWWATLQPEAAEVCTPSTQGEAQTRVLHAWRVFQDSFCSSTDPVLQGRHVHLLWKEVMWALHFCDGIADVDGIVMEPAQHELARVLKACSGLSVFFRGFILTSIMGQCWVVPSQASRHLERLVAFLHVEFTSQRLS